MNLCDSYVTEVLGKPYKMYGKWFVEVKSDSWGHVSECTIMCNTEEEALLIRKGHHHFT